MPNHSHQQLLQISVKRLLFLVLAFAMFYVSCTVANSAVPKIRSYTYNYNQSTQRLTDISHASGGTAFNLAYDDRGNVTSRSGAGTPSFGFVFDRAQRIRQFTSTAVNASENYSYDAKGQRAVITSANDSSQKRYQVYSDGGQLVWEVDADGSKKRHVYLGGTLLARENIGSTATAAEPPALLGFGSIPCGFTSCPLATSFKLFWNLSTTVPAPGVVFKYKLQRCQLDSNSACDWENNQMLYAVPTASQTQMVWTPGSSAATNAAGPNFGGLNSFRVTVCANDVCESAWTYSNNLGIRPPLTSAVVPTGTQVGSFQITWPASSGASSYQLERGIGSPALWTNIVSTSATSMTVTPPANGDYRFRVTAINSYGNRGVGPESALVSYTQPTVCTPGVPENSAANVSNGISTTGNFTVSWSASGCGTVQ
jgi:hypothetical protein